MQILLNLKQLLHTHLILIFKIVMNKFNKEINSKVLENPNPRFYPKQIFLLLFFSRMLLGLLIGMKISFINI